MMVHLLGDDRDARHEAEGLRKIPELEAPRDRITFGLVRPVGEAGEQRGARRIVEFLDHPSSPAGKGRPPAIRKDAMSDKSALSALPAGWTGGATDADRARARAGAAAQSLPDSVKTHLPNRLI